MESKLIHKSLSVLMIVVSILILFSVTAFAEDAPFFCSTTVSSGLRLEKDQFLSGWFDPQDYIYRTDLEAIDYYTSTERTVCIYDDGEDALFTSDSGYYFGRVNNDSTTTLYAFLQTECGIENSQYGYMSVSSYKSNDGYWIVGRFGDFSYGLFYIDLANERCYYCQTKGFNIKPCFSDRFIMLYDNDHFVVIDRDKCEAQVINLAGIDVVPYFDSEGVATLIVNSKYGANDQDYMPDFYKYNDYYYYSWELGNVYSVSYMNYDYVCYADDRS